MARFVVAYGSNTSHAWAAQLQGHHEVLDDLESTARRHKATLKHRLDSAALLGRGGGSTHPDNDSAADALIRERSALLGSHKAIGMFILTGKRFSFGALTISVNSRFLDAAMEQAQQAHDSLVRQRASLNVTMSGVGALMLRVPGVNLLMGAIQRRRTRNDQVVAVVIGVCVCFLVWWFILRKS
jgi:hypothetical protein